MLIAPAGLYLIAHLIFPEPSQNKDIREYYYGPLRPIWWLAVLTTLSSVVFRPLAFGSEILTGDNLTSLLLLIGFAILGMTINPLVHSTLVPTFLGLILWDIVRWHPVFIGS